MEALKNYARKDLLKNEDYSKEAFLLKCENIAETLLNRTVLLLKTKEYRIREVEFYVYGPEYADIFAHQHPQQLKFGYWHFHRAGKKEEAGFRTGTRKGLDLTLGTKNHYFGVLLRSIESEGVRIDGSSLLVDEILRHWNVSEVKELPREAYFELVYKEDLERTEYVRAPRVGLNIQKKSIWKEYVDHMFAPLRFIAQPEKTTKGRELLFLHQAHLKNENEATDLLKLNSTTAGNWLAHSRSGKSQDLSELLEEKNSSVEQICKVYGAYLDYCRNKSSQ